MLSHQILHVVKSALQQAIETTVQEGLPLDVLSQLQADWLALATAAEAGADAVAAAALDIDEGDASLDVVECVQVPATQAVAQVLAPEVGVSCSGPEAGEVSLIHWVHGQRRQGVSWTTLAHGAVRAGHGTSEKSLRKRYRRWCQNTDPTHAEV